MGNAISQQISIWRHEKWKKVTKTVKCSYQYLIGLHFPDSLHTKIVQTRIIIKESGVWHIKVMRIKETIADQKEFSIVLKILLISTFGHVLRTIWRICTLMLECKGFKESAVPESLLVLIYPFCWRNTPRELHFLLEKTTKKVSYGCFCCFVCAGGKGGGAVREHKTDYPSPSSCWGSSFHL